MAENNARFSFPGFQLIGSQDSEEGTHEEMTGTISLGKTVFDIKLVRFKKIGKKGTFLPSSIEATGKKWLFSDEKFQGIAMLAMAGEKTPVIALIQKGVRKVERIIFLEDIPHGITYVEMNGKVEAVGRPRPILDVMKAKYAAAKYLKIGVIDSEDEERAFSVFQQQLAEKAEAARKAEVERIKAERSAMAEAFREERRREAEKAAAERRAKAEESARRTLLISNRSHVRVFTGDGKIKYGIPVTEAEWESLPDGVYAIIVESYNDKKPREYKPVSAFWMGKTKGGKPSRHGEIPVFLDEPKSGKNPSAISAVKTIIIDRGKGLERVIVFESLSSIKAAADKNLNGGSLAAVEGKGNEFEVYSLSSKRVRNVGVFSAI